MAPLITDTSSQTINNGPVPTISANIVSHRMRQSLQVVMAWQKAEVPSRLVIGSGDLRKLTIRVREQPVNFMIIIHQSLKIAKDGTGLCQTGYKASTILLGEEKHDERAIVQFTAKTLEEMKNSASDLNKYTIGMSEKFRSLRIVILGKLHKDLNKVNSEEERSSFLARLSRHLSKDVKISEDVLRRVLNDLEEIENSLNVINSWWLKVEMEVNNLHENSKSSLATEQNPIQLNAIKQKFTTLEKYFMDYLEEMHKVYANNIILLEDKEQKYVRTVQDRTDLVISNKGRFEPKMIHITGD